jgi:protein-S-isoprenylcysteine O-methyltransferase Ste14
MFLWIIPCLIRQLDLFLGIPVIGFSFQKEIACVVFVLASILGLTSGLTMAFLGCGTPFPLDCCSELVVQGPYRFVRNPMAVAGLLQGAAVGLWYGSYLILLYVISGMLIWNYAVRPVEEADLKRRFGRQYEQYCQKIKCWVPSIRGYKS